MTFRVIVADPALVDMEETVDFIRVESPVSARRWLSDCEQAIVSLKEMPLRHALIPEAEVLGFPYRSLPLHEHRLIYRVDEERSTVYIVHVYHGARQPLKLADV